MIWVVNRCVGSKDSLKAIGTVEANVGTAPSLVNSQIETRYIHAARRRAQ